jgi:hypothetical protein
LSILDFSFGFLFISACWNGNLCFLISFMILRIRHHIKVQVLLLNIHYK